MVYIKNNNNQLFFDYQIYFELFLTRDMLWNYKKIINSMGELTAGCGVVIVIFCQDK